MPSSERIQSGSITFWVIPNTGLIALKYKPSSVILNIYKIHHGQYANKYACVFGILHNDAGPAYVSDMAEAWFVNGIRHRTDGPAAITKEWQTWYANGAIHRLDGPAVVPSQLVQQPFCGYYYVNGKPYNPSADYLKAVARWLSYREVTRSEIKQQIGQFRIVEWE